MQTLAVPLQTESRPDEGLALTWIEVSGAIRYGLVIGVPGVPMPDLKVIMRGQTRQFAIVGIPARFTGAVDIGTPAGATRQFGLVAYRNDGGIFPVSSLRIYPARSAPRDREYHAVVPPALVDTSPTPQPVKAADPNDPWSALEAAAPASSATSTTNVTFTAPQPSVEPTPYVVSQPTSTSGSSQTPAPYDPWDVLSRPQAAEPEPEPEPPPPAEPTPSYEDRYTTPAQSFPYESTPRYEPTAEPSAAEPEPPVEQPWTPSVEPEASLASPVTEPWTPAVEPEPYVGPPVEPVAYEPPPVSLPEPLDNGRATDAADETTASVESATATEIVSPAPNINQAAEVETVQADRDSSTISSPGDEWNPSTLPTGSAVGEAFTSPTIGDTAERAELPVVGESVAQPSTSALDSIWGQPAPPTLNVEPEPRGGDAETTARFEPATVESVPPVESPAATLVSPPISPAPPEEAPSPPAPPLPVNLGALLDEAELYLLPQWADSAAALSLVEQVEREVPGHPRTQEVRVRIENMIAGSAPAVEESESAIEDDSGTPAPAIASGGEDSHSTTNEPIGVEEPPTINEEESATTVPSGVEEPVSIIEEEPATTIASSAEEPASTIDDDSTQITDLLEKGTAVDYYEQVPAEKPEHEVADAGTRWPLRLAESAGDASALRAIGKDFEAEAPDLAGQAYAAAFAIQPAPDVLRSWLLAFVQAGYAEVIAGTARRAVHVLEESGKIIPNPSVTGALESLEQVTGDGGAGTEAAVNHLYDELVGAAQ